MGSGAAVLAPIVAAAVFLAGCGQARPGVLLARGHAAAHQREPAGGGGPPAGSRSAALALAGRLLSGLIVPPGARAVAPGAAAGAPRGLAPLLRRPSLPLGGDASQQVDVHRVFSLRLSMAAAQSFLEAHVPAGMRLNGYSQFADPGGSASGRGMTAEPGEAAMLSVSYAPRALPAGINQAELDASVVPAPGGGSVLRADAEAIWYPRRSAAENLDAAGIRAVRISAQLLNPRPHAVTRTFTAAAVIARVVRRFDGLPAAPYAPVSCLMFGTYKLTFIPSAAAAPRTVVTASGCATDGVTVGGAAQPPLLGGEDLARLGMRLLHLRPTQL
jgi:hypothetical protein